MPIRSATLRWIAGSAACVGVATVRRCGSGGRDAMQLPASCAPPHDFKSAAAGFFSRMFTALSSAFAFCACRSAIAAMSGVMARPAVVDEPERVDAVCCRPLELLLVVLFCPEPESVDDDSLEREVLAVCVVPLVCASGCDEEELVELLELLVVLLDVVVVLEELVLCGAVLDEVLVEVSLGAEEDDVDEV